jgi:hypothetical protein
MRAKFWQLATGNWQLATSWPLLERVRSQAFTRLTWRGLEWPQAVRILIPGKDFWLEDG